MSGHKLTFTIHFDPEVECVEESWLNTLVDSLLFSADGVTSVEYTDAWEDNENAICDWKEALNDN